MQPGDQARRGLRRPCLRRRHCVPSGDFVGAQGRGTQWLPEAVKWPHHLPEAPCCASHLWNKESKLDCLPGRTLLRVKPWSGSASAEPVLQAPRWCRRPPIGTLRRLGILGRAAIFSRLGRSAACDLPSAKFGKSGCAPRLPCLLHLIALIEGSCKYVRFPYHMPRLGLGGRRI
jgi:hypothetical protein